MAMKQSYNSHEAEIPWLKDKDIMAVRQRKSICSSIADHFTFKTAILFTCYTY